MSNDGSHPNQKSGLGKLLREDLRRGDFRRTMLREYNELKDFFLNDQRKTRLKEMSRLKRWLHTAWWLLEALFMKLTPARRLLLVLVFLIIIFFPHRMEFTGDRFQIGVQTSAFAIVILLFILMLELKDKLLARDELEAGRAVQTALMPERTPTVPGWSVWLFTRTANEVGGDLVDLQKLDTNRFRISLADVAGKGLKAALLTAKLQATLRALAPDLEALSDVGTKLNRIFYRDSLRNFFASLVCIEVKSDSGTLRILNAGHLPPILVRGTAIEEMRKGDPAIGIFPEAVYVEQQSELKDGEIFLVYTDGLTEAKNEAGEFFGMQRLLNILPTMRSVDAKDAGERIVQEVDRFVGEARIYDDLSLVILKRAELR